jgi:(4-(4-[2-(gamma-L-glutamylamino)ethyl]phenoxymethyl)furan-2-yl)methanamine synthase
MTWLALDIGGANLKVADGRQYAVCRPFPLWKQPRELAGVLRTLLAEAPSCSRLALTMTGELADCFATKAEGVQFIVSATLEAAVGRVLWVYQTGGRLVGSEDAVRSPRLVAAANWHALARFAGRYAARGVALLMDVGSTTVDLIPLIDGVPCATGATDTERLLAGELVYTGIERSPVCAMASQVPYRGQTCPLAQEFFATARDIYLVLGELPEEPENCDTADGRSATPEAALGRLARMICADRAEFDHADGIALAQAVSAAQAAQVLAAARKVLTRLPAPPETVILSGHGNFLAQRVLHELGFAGPIVSLATVLGHDFARCATAHALAVLASEGF